MSIEKSKLTEEQMEDVTGGLVLNSWDEKKKEKAVWIGKNVLENIAKKNNGGAIYNVDNNTDDNSDDDYRYNVPCDKTMTRIK